MLVKIYKTKEAFQFELCFLQEKETNYPHMKLRKFEFDFCFYERVHDV